MQKAISGKYFPSFWLAMEFSAQSGSRLPHRSRYSWVELFSLSAVFHGLLFGCAAIGWILWEGKGSLNLAQKGTGGGNPTVCFWDETPTKPVSEPNRGNREKGFETAELSPFTIQLSPVGMVAGSVGALGVGPNLTRQPTNAAEGPSGSNSWFDSGLLPENVAWVVDSSLSMGINAHFEAAGNQLIQALGKTSPSTKNRVWFFSHTIREVAPIGGWGPMTPSRFDQLKTELATVKPSGNTDLGAALRSVLASGPGVIHVVTDEDLLTQKDLNALFRLQARQAKPMPRMRVVVLTRPRQETPLQSWCRQAGCSYKIVEKGAVGAFSGKAAIEPSSYLEPATPLPPPESSFPSRQSRPGGH